MTKPARITKDEFRIAIEEAKKAGAARVIFDGGRIVVDLKGDVDEGAKDAERKAAEREWGDAA